jgi:hypothetical protein
MRKWIALFESFDWSKLSPEQLLDQARAHGLVMPGPTEAMLKAVDYDWHFEPAYPVVRICLSDWEEWWKEETEMWAEEGQPDRYADMLDRPIEEPIIVVDVGGKGYLWDGCHRTAAATVRHLPTLPAIVGTPKA